MNKLINYRKLLPWLILLAFLSGGCSSIIAKYDSIAYHQATSLKVESLAVMDKAVEQYTKHENMVNELKINVEKAYEYAKGRPKNEIITKQWGIVKDPNRNLLGGFIKRWKEKGRLSVVLVNEAKGNVSKAYDQIIGLESGLIKPKGSE